MSDFGGVSTHKDGSWTITSTSSQEKLDKTFAKPDEKAVEAPEKAPEGATESNPDSPVVDPVETAPEASKAGKDALDIDHGDPRKNPKARIDRLNRELSSEKARADEIERRHNETLAELQRLRGGNEPKVQARPKETDSGERPKPTIDQFETLEDWEEAVESWRDEKKALKAQKEAEQRQTEEVISGYSKRMQEHIKGKPDFWQTISPRVVNWRPLSDLIREGVDLRNLDPRVKIEGAIADYILVSETPGPLTEYFSGKPEEVDRLLGIHPRRLYAEVGKIEDRLVAAHPTTDSAKPVKMSRANPPVQPVTAVPPSASDSLDLTDKTISNKEWIRRRELVEEKRHKANSN
jgi:hypothetical protein